VGQEPHEFALAFGALVESAQPEGAANGVHAHVTGVDTDVPFRAGADQPAFTGVDAKRPKRSALVFHSATQHGQRAPMIPNGDSGAVTASDNHIGARSLTDFIVDDAAHHVNVFVVAGLKTAAIDDVNLVIGQCIHDICQRDRGADVAVNHGQRGFVFACV